MVQRTTIVFGLVKREGEGASEGVIDFEMCNCLTIASVRDITLHFSSKLTVSKL